MTKDEIEETLGKPNSITSAIKYEDDASIFAKFFINAMFDGWYEKWYYGKDPSILSSIIPFYPSGPPRKTYIVYFDKEGRVAGYLKPSDNGNYKTRTSIWPRKSRENNTPLESDSSFLFFRSSLTDAIPKQQVRRFGFCFLP